MANLSNPSPEVIFAMVPAFFKPPFLRMGLWVTCLVLESSSLSSAFESTSFLLSSSMLSRINFSLLERVFCSFYSGVFKDTWLTFYLTALPTLSYIPSTSCFYWNWDNYFFYSSVSKLFMNSFSTMWWFLWVAISSYFYDILTMIFSFLANFFSKSFKYV